MADSNNNNEPEKKNNDGKKPGSGAKILILIISIVLALIFIQQFAKFKKAGEQEVSYDKFIEMVEQKEIERVEIYNNKIYLFPKKDSSAVLGVTYYVQRTDDYGLVDRLAAADVKFQQIDEGGSVLVRTILSYVVMIGMFYLLMMLIFRGASKGGGIMGVGKSGAKLYDVEKSTGVTFKDVAGEEEAKESLEEMVDFLKRPEKYLEIGAKLPKGALLVGPPGTGKTLLAKAVAGEAGVPFFSMSGSEFVEMYVGVGASRVRDLFKQATEKAPCIIFIDEIDAIGRSRDTRQMGGDSEREQTLNQLLSEMDGFDSSKGIVILAATNRPEVLDKALLRPGRFDRRVVVERPDLKGREDILRVHSKNVKLDETVDLHELALATSGAVGADLANVINEAALLAVRKKRSLVSQKDLIEAVELVDSGKEKKNRILSEEEKRIVAYHETGHALLTVLQKHTMPIQKITIVPRTTGALGYVWMVPEEEKTMETQVEMESQIVIACAGRAAEAIKFESVTSGAASDIEQATKLARAMVMYYGMSEKFGMVQLAAITGEFLDRRSVMQCSEETQTKIDNEVRNIIKAAYERAYDILSENEPILDAIAAFLIEHETITGKEFIEIYNRVVKELGRESEVIEVKEDIFSSNGMNSGTDFAAGAPSYAPVSLTKKTEKSEKADKEEKSEKKKKKKKDKEKELKEEGKHKVRVFRAEEPKTGFVPSEPSKKAVKEAEKTEDKAEEKVVTAEEENVVPKMVMPWEAFAKSQEDSKDSEKTVEQQDSDPQVADQSEDLVSEETAELSSEESEEESEEQTTDLVWEAEEEETSSDDKTE